MAVNRPKRFNRLAAGFFLLFGFFLIFSGTLKASDPPSGKTEIISLEKTPEGLAALAASGNEWDFLLETAERIYLLVCPQDLAFFQTNRLKFRLETHLFPPAFPSAGAMSPSSGANGAYHSYSEVVAELNDLAKRYPGLAQVKEAGRSHEGRSILVLKISDNVASKEPEPGLLFLGCHHAREWISVEVPLLTARYLLENYELRPDVRQLVNGTQLWFIPLVNPDGLEYSIRVYRYWRKNRRANEDGTFGVDLNRNYGFSWGIDNRGSSPNPASEVYRGPAPFSEPETRAVRDLFLENRIDGLISYHSYSQVILYPWGFTTAPADKAPLLLDLARRMSDLMAAVNGRRYVFGQASTLLYLTNGDTTDWAYGIAGIPAYTIELPPVDILNGGFFNSEADIQPIFAENLEAALDLIVWCLENNEGKYRLNQEEEKDLDRIRYQPVMKSSAMTKIK